jgi:hypothetical protein
MIVCFQKLSMSNVEAGFVDELRRTQQSLNREWSMNQIETQCRRDQYQYLETAFLDRIADQKHHYLLLYLLLSLPDSMPEWKSELLQPPTWSRVSAPYTTFASLRSRIPRITDPGIIDCLTFSGLPCHFSFFFSEEGVNYFFDVLRAVESKPDLHDKYSRIAFLSPMFLAFTKLVFRPTLSPLLPKERPPRPDAMEVEIIKRWQWNVSLLPHAVVQLLQTSRDPKRTLSKAFFEYALDSHNARVLGLVSFFQKLTPELTQLLRGLLTMDGDIQILDKLVTISIESTCESVPLLTSEDKRAVPALFQRVMLSTLDNNCYSAISIRGHFVLPEIFRTDAYLMSGECENDSSLNLNEITMRGLRLEVVLRHLLQAADPLPVFHTAPRLTLRDFFIQYLVRRGPHETFHLRSELMEMLESMGLWDNPRRIVTAMKQTSLHRTKEIHALSTFTSIIGKCGRLDELTSDIRTDIEKVFLFCLMEPVFQSAHLNPTADYSTQLSRIPRDLTLLIQSVPDGHLRHFQIVAYGYLTAGIEFEQFSESRPDLQELNE